MPRKNNFSTLPEEPDLYILFILYFKFEKYINQGSAPERDRDPEKFLMPGFEHLNLRNLISVRMPYPGAK